MRLFSFSATKLNLTTDFSKQGFISSVGAILETFIAECKMLNEAFLDVRFCTLNDFFNNWEVVSAEQCTANIFCSLKITTNLAWVISNAYFSQMYFLSLYWLVYHQWRFCLDKLIEQWVVIANSNKQYALKHFFVELLKSWLSYEHYVVCLGGGTGEGGLGPSYFSVENKRNIKKNR